MKNKVYVLTLVGLLTTASFFSNAEKHHHHENHTAKLVLNKGQKWQIDESLHLGMSKVKGEIKANLEAIHHERFSANQFKTLATTLDKHLTYLFENCNLAPEADAQLHILLAKIMQGVDKMKHAENKKQGAILIIQALQKYPVYFADSRWENLLH